MQKAAEQLGLFEGVQSGEAPSLSIRRSSRARRLSIKVYPLGKVEVVVPRRTRARDVESFIAENRDWIDNAKRAFEAQYTPASLVIPDVIDLPAIGRRYILMRKPESGATSVRFREANGMILLSGATHDQEQLLCALKRWLAGVARQQFEPWIARLAKKSGLRYRRVQVRMQRTCWGSHSSNGTISLNLCLLFLDPALVGYLMIHELSHSRHMNHSRRFWQLVGQHVPDYRRLDRKLGEAWRAVPNWLHLY